MIRIVNLVICLSLAVAGCSGRRTDRQQCYLNLRAAHAACEAAAVSARRTDGDALTWAEAAPYIRPQDMICPATEEKYVITTVGKNPLCPKHGNLLSDRELDAWYDDESKKWSK